jgi:hypothetical protein
VLRTGLKKASCREAVCATHAGLLAVVVWTEVSCRHKLSFTNVRSLAVHTATVGEARVLPPTARRGQQALRQSWTFAPYGRNRCVFGSGRCNYAVVNAPAV